VILLSLCAGLFIWQWVAKRNGEDLLPLINHQVSFVVGGIIILVAFFRGLGDGNALKTGPGAYSAAVELHDPFQKYSIYYELSPQELAAFRNNRALQTAERLYLVAATVEESKVGFCTTSDQDRHLSNAIQCYLRLSLLYRQRYECETSKAYAQKALDGLQRLPAEARSSPEKVIMKSDALFRLVEADDFTRARPGVELIARYEECLLLDRQTGNQDGMQTTSERLAKVRARLEQDGIASL
jgi:hypothetical protein